MAGMVESIVGILAVTCVAVSAGLTAAVVRLNKRSRQLQKALIALQQDVASWKTHFAGEDTDPLSSLGGLRIAIAISQDHTIPTLTLLLKDELSACDAEVTLLDPALVDQLVNNWGSEQAVDQPDVLIFGSITCNGYSEFYYKAMLSYLTPYGMLNPTSEQPSQGNPQAAWW